MSTTCGCTAACTGRTGTVWRGTAFTSGAPGTARPSTAGWWRSEPLPYWSALTWKEPAQKVDVNRYLEGEVPH